MKEEKIVVTKSQLKRLVQKASNSIEEYNKHAIGLSNFMKAYKGKDKQLDEFIVKLNGLLFDGLTKFKNL